jgi:hypothetical protein
LEFLFLLFSGVLLLRGRLSGITNFHSQIDFIGQVFYHLFVKYSCWIFRDISTHVIQFFETTFGSWRVIRWSFCFYGDRVVPPIKISNYNPAHLNKCEALIRFLQLYATRTKDPIVVPIFLWSLKCVGKFHNNFQRICNVLSKETWVMMVFDQPFCWQRSLWSDQWYVNTIWLGNLFGIVQQFMLIEIPNQIIHEKYHNYWINIYIRSIIQLFLSKPISSVLILLI